MKHDPFELIRDGGLARLREVLATRDVRELRNSDGNTLLHAACLPGPRRRLIVQALLATSGIAVDARNNIERTALHHAVLLNRPEIIEFLLASGADLDAQDRSRVTPLFVAILDGANRLAAWLRARGARETIETLITKKELEHVEAELARDPELRPTQANFQKLLHHFTTRVRTSLMRKSPSFSYDPERLQKADIEFLRHEDVITWLLDLGARPMLGSYSPTQDAIQIASPRLLKLFIAHGANPEIYADLLDHAPERVEAIHIGAHAAWRPDEALTTPSRQLRPWDRFTICSAVISSHLRCAHHRSPSVSLDWPPAPTRGWSA